MKEKETARRGEILELPPEVIRKNWSFAVDALERALEVMTDRYGCYGERFVPFVDIIAPMAIIITSRKFDSGAEAFTLLDRWYWRCVFSQYFISATETKIQRTVRQWLGKEGEADGWIENHALEPDSVKEFSYRTSILDDVSRVDNAVYRGVISLLLARKVHDLGAERKSIAAARWEEIEDHHIYPKGFLAPNGVRGEKVNNIANRTPLMRSTNAAIGNLAPNVYLMNKVIVGNEFFEGVLKEHLIDQPIVLRQFSVELYDEFLAARKKEILAP